MSPLLKINNQIFLQKYSIGTGEVVEFMLEMEMEVEDVESNGRPTKHITYTLTYEVNDSKAYQALILKKIPP